MESTKIADKIAREINWDCDLAQEVIIHLLREVNMHTQNIAIQRALASFDESQGTEIEFQVQLKLNSPTEKPKDLIWEMGTLLMQGVVRQAQEVGLTPLEEDSFVKEVWITSGALFSDVTTL